MPALTLRRPCLSQLEKDRGLHEVSESPSLFVDVLPKENGTRLLPIGAGFQCGNLHGKPRHPCAPALKLLSPPLFRAFTKYV